MHSYFFKTVRNLYENYYKIYDVNGKLIKVSFGMVILMLLLSLFYPAPTNYLTMLSKGMALTGVDCIYDYAIPAICSSVIIYAFYYDYNNSNIYELIAFYNYNKFNYIVFIRWIIYFTIFAVGSFITGLFYYRGVSFLDLKNILLSLRFIPNLIFIASLVLLIITSTKNIYVAIFLILSYIMCDYLSGSHFLKLISIGANTNNFYYRISKEYYIVNRITLILIGILNVYISGKISSK